MISRKAFPSSFALAALRRIPLLLLPAILSALVLLSCPRAAEAKYASMVIDADTGEVFHAVNADARNYPASLTKMMTLYILFDHLNSGKVKLSDRITISAYAAKQQPSKLGLRPGQTISVEDAILALCIKSANDIAVAVAEHIGGTESAFAQAMTNKAANLGMRQTQFRNASGLPNLNQYSTARDMTVLARALIRNHARYYHYFSTRSFSYNGAEMRNHNRLMEWYDGVDGIKTGYIAASGFNLVSSAKRGGRRLIGVVFGGESGPARDRHMANLLDTAFSRAGSSPDVRVASATPDAAPKNQTARKNESDYRAVEKAMAMAKAGENSVLPKPRRTAIGDQGEEASWAVQVGAFSQQKSAESAANSALRKLGSLASSGAAEAQPISNKTKSLYRARIVGLSENTAREACRRLGNDRNACHVVNTGTALASR